MGGTDNHTNTQGEESMRGGDLHRWMVRQLESMASDAGDVFDYYANSIAHFLPETPDSAAPAEISAPAK